MSWQTLKPQLKTLLEGIKTGGTAVFQEVSRTPKFAFTGYPAAYVAESDNESDYSTTIENSRLYSFVIRAFYSTKSIGVDEAIQRLEKIVDAVIDEIDKDSLKPSTTRIVGINMPSKYTWINTFASPSVFGEVEGQELVMAEIRVRIRVIYDITS